MPAIPDFSVELMAILPEILLVVGGIGLLLAGIKKSPEESGGLASLAVVGLVAALVALLVPRTLAESGPLLFGAITSDGLSLFLRAVIFAGGLLVLLSGSEYVYRFRLPSGEFYGLFLLAMAGAGFMASANNLLTFYVGLELLSFSSYIMVGLQLEDDTSNEAVLKYFFNGAIASAILLFGASWLFGLTGTIDFGVMAQRLADGTTPGLLTTIALAFVIGGFGFKLASVPFHLWAPDVYQGAPTPVAAFLSVGSKGAALAAALRVFYVALAPVSDRWTLYWGILAAVSMTWGNVTALQQTNIKRLFGYSSVAQGGYILVGLAAGTQLGLTSAMFYMLVYTLTNIGAFAVITALANAGGTYEISGFSGLARRHPYLGVAMLVFLLSLVGVPFTAGFFGKFHLIGAAVEAGLIWLAVITAVNSVISVGYYYNVIRTMYLRPAPEGAPVVAPGMALTTAVTVALIGTLGAGIIPQFFGWAQMAALIP